MLPYARTVGLLSLSKILSYLKHDAASTPVILHAFECTSKSKGVVFPSQHDVFMPVSLSLSCTALHNSHSFTLLHS